MASAWALLLRRHLDNVSSKELARQLDLAAGCAFQDAFDADPICGRDAIYIVTSKLAGAVRGYPGGQPSWQARQNAQMGVVNRLARVRPGVHQLTTRNPLTAWPVCWARCEATTISRPNSSASAIDASASEAMWRVGITSSCIGALGPMSWKATTWSSRYVMAAGISPLTILQNRQSVMRAPSCLHRDTRLTRRARVSSRRAFTGALAQKIVDGRRRADRFVGDRVGAIRLIGAQRDECPGSVLRPAAVAQLPSRLTVRGSATASIRRDSDCSTSTAGQWWRAAISRDSTTCPSRMPRTSSAIGSSMSPPATSTV